MEPNKAPSTITWFLPVRLQTYTIKVKKYDSELILIFYDKQADKYIFVVVGSWDEPAKRKLTELGILNFDGKHYKVANCTGKFFALAIQKYKLVDIGKVNIKELNHV